MQIFNNHWSFESGRNFLPPGLGLFSLLLMFVVSPCFGQVNKPILQDVKCEGDYAGHLQGVCIDDDAIYWSYTTNLVKTHQLGKILKQIEVPTHHGDLCYHKGRLYVAVNLGSFNDPKGNASSWVYVYDANSLELLAKHATPEVFFGAGGMGFRDGRFYVIGGLPNGVEENYVHEYDEEFKFIKKHVIKSGWTFLGIQTATFHDGFWWFGCYGTPKILLKTDADFKMIGRYELDCSLGVVGIAKDQLLIAKGPRTKEGRHMGSLHRVRPDAKKGLVFLPKTVSARDSNQVEKIGSWRSDQFRFAASSHLFTEEDKAALKYEFNGTGIAIRLGGHKTPAYGRPSLGTIAISIDNGLPRTLKPQAVALEVVLADQLEPGPHSVRVEHRSNGNLAGCRIESFHSWNDPRGEVQFSVTAENNGFLTDCRAIVRSGETIVRNTLVRNWLTGQCAITGLPPGEDFTLEVQAAGWQTYHSEVFNIEASAATELPAIYLQRTDATTIREFRFPRVNQPAIRKPGESFRARFLGHDATIVEVRLTRQVGPAVVSRVVDFQDIKEAAYYYDREVNVALPENISPGVYDLSVTIKGKGRDGICRSPRSVHVVSAYPADPVFFSFGHLDTSGQFQAEYLERLVEVANILAPDMVLCSTAANPAYLSGALSGLEMPYVINFGNHQVPGHEAWFGDSVGLIDYGPNISILNFGHAWHVGASQADALLSSRPDAEIKVINAFEPNTPLELLDRLQVRMIHDAHGPGERVQSIGKTPTQRIGKINSESFRLIRFQDNQVVSCTYNDHKTAPIPFARNESAPLSLAYVNPNDGSHAKNSATITNDLLDAFPQGRITFVMPAGNYHATGGQLDWQATSDDGRYQIVSIQADIPENGSAEVTVEVK